MATEKKFLTDEDVFKSQEVKFGGGKPSRGITAEFETPDSLTDEEVSNKETVGKIVSRNFKNAIEETKGTINATVNTALFGIPDILSQKLAEVPFIPEDLSPEARQKGELLGLILPGGGPSRLAKAVGSKVLPKSAKFLSSVVRGAAVGGSVAGTQLPSPEEAKTLEETLEILGEQVKKGAIFGGVAAGALHAVGKIPTIRQYARNATLRIRNKWRGHAQKEYVAYDEGINNLPNQQIKGEEVINNLERKLVTRGVMNPDGTISKNVSITSADRKLLNSYNRLYKQWSTSKGGELQSKDIIREYRAIKGRYVPKPSINQIENKVAANELFESVKPQIRTESFKDINTRYTKFKNREELVDKWFGVRSTRNPLITQRAENFITRGLKGAGEPLQVRKVIKETTGETLKGGVFLTKLDQALSNPLTRWVAGGAAAAAGFRQFGRREDK